MVDIERIGQALADGAALAVLHQLRLGQASGGLRHGINTLSHIQYTCMTSLIGIP